MFAAKRNVRHLVPISSAHHVLIHCTVVHRGLLETQGAVEDGHGVHSSEELCHFRCRHKQLPRSSVRTRIEVADARVSCNGRAPGDVGQALRIVALLDIELIRLGKTGHSLVQCIRHLSVQRTVCCQIGVDVAAVAPRLFLDVGLRIEDGLVDELGRLQVIAVLVGIVGTDDVFLGEKAQRKHGHDGQGGLDVEHGISLNRVQI